MKLSAAKNLALCCQQLISHTAFLVTDNSLLVVGNFHLTITFIVVNNLTSPVCGDHYHNAVFLILGKPRQFFLKMYYLAFDSRDKKTSANFSFC